MQTLFKFIWLKSLVLLLILLGVRPSSLAAQGSYPFSNRPTLFESQLNNRSFHITNKETDQFIGPVTDEIRGLPTYDQGPQSIWLIDDGPTVYKWFEGEGNRFFGIKSALTNEYITVTQVTDGAEVNMLPRYDNDDPLMERQQFELVPSPAGSGWYRLKSRVGAYILELSTSGKMLLVDAPVLANDRQRFGFNLAMPFDASRSFVILNRENQNYVTDKGLSGPITPAKHIEDPDNSVMWNFIPLGNDEFYIKNQLTGHYLSSSGSTTAGDPVFATYTLDASAKWRLERNAATFDIINVLSGYYLSTKDKPGEDKPLFHATRGLPGYRWLLIDITQEEPVPMGGNYNNMLTGAGPPQLCFNYGEQFKRGVLERVGLPDDLSYWPIIYDALESYYGSADKADRALQNYNLDDPGHRAELQYAMREYILGPLGTNPSTLSTLELAVMDHYRARVIALRQAYAVQLQQAWTNFKNSYLPPSGQYGFSALLQSLDASDFVWPTEYPMLSASQEASLADYMNANYSFDNINTLGADIGGGATAVTLAGVAIALQVAVFSGINTISLFAPAIASKIISGAAASALSPLVAGGGGALTVAVIAVTVLVMEIIKVDEVMQLEDKVYDKIAFATDPNNVQISSTLLGIDELAKSKLRADLDYVIAVESSNFQYNTNDNSIENVSLNCGSASVDLGTTGSVTINANNFVKLLNPGLCTELNPYEYTVTTQTVFTADDLGVNPVTILGTNDQIPVTCTTTVTVNDPLPPVARCKNATINLPPDGNGTLTVDDINDGSSDNAGIVSYTLSMTAFDCSHVSTPTANTTSLVTLTVSDAAGNSDQCQANVQVEDHVVPIAVCTTNPVVVQLDAQGMGSLSVNDIDAGSNDACGIAARSLDKSTFDCNDVGSGTVTLTVLDPSGNSKSCAATVLVKDEVVPVIASCTGGTIEFNGEEVLPITDVVTVLADDACGLASTTYSIDEISCTEIGNVLTVIATVTDVNDNPVSCITQVNVSGLPCGFVDNPDGIGCTNGNVVDYNASTEVFTLESTNCYAPPTSPQDEAAFAQYNLCGNGSITVQLTNMSGQGWAGVAMRESANAGAKKAQLMINGSNLARREVRYSTNGTASMQQIYAFNKQWLRMERVGNQFRGWLSYNGVSWENVMTVNVSMGSCIEMGMLLTNYNSNSTVTATFANVSAIEGNNSLQTVSTPMVATVSTAAQDVEVFPNPTTGEVQIRLPLTVSSTIHVLDLNGRAMLPAIQASRDEVERINLSSLPNGVYFVRISSTDGQLWNERLLLQR